MQYTPYFLPPLDNWHRFQFPWVVLLLEGITSQKNWRKWIEFTNNVVHPLVLEVWFALMKMPKHTRPKLLLTFWKRSTLLFWSTHHICKISPYVTFFFYFIWKKCLFGRSNASRNGIGYAKYQLINGIPKKTFLNELKK